MAEKKVTTKEAKTVVKKPTASKAAVKEVKPVVKKTTKPVVEKKEGTLTVALFDTAGKEKGTVTLPEAIFGAKVNPVLMAQAVRVYLANQRVGAAVTKTRSQVALTTAKWYRQKGTGRARHGAQSAPIFVGGGTAHGPKSRDYSLNFPAKMKRAALLSSLSQAVKDGQIKVVAGFTSVEPKTKAVAPAFRAMGVKKALFVMPSHLENVFKAVRNIKSVTVTAASQLSTYDVLNAGTLIFMEEAIKEMQEGKK